jgi:hypothetical protein
VVLDGHAARVVTDGRDRAIAGEYAGVVIDGHAGDRVVTEGRDRAVAGEYSHMYAV